MYKYFLLFASISLTSFAQTDYETLKSEILKENPFEYVYNFEHDRAVFRLKESKMGVINSQKEIIIKPEYSYIYNNPNIENLLEVGQKTKNGYKRGFIDLNNQVVIPIIYDYVFYLNNNTIKVGNKNKYGLLTTKNKVILPLEFDNIYSGKMIYALKDTYYNVYDSLGNLVSEKKYIDISLSSHGYYIGILPDTSFEFLNPDGELLFTLPNTGKNYQFINEEFIYIKDKNFKNIGILDLKGNIIIPDIYDEVYYDRNFFKVKKNDKYQIVDKNNKIVVTDFFDEIYNGVSQQRVVKINDKSGVFNLNTGKYIIPVQYKSISADQEFYVVYNDKNKKGIFNLEGDNLLPLEYSFHTRYNNYVFAEKGGENFLLILDKKGLKITKLTCQKLVKRITDYSSNYPFQIFIKDGKYGVYTFDGSEQISAQYQEIIPVHEFEYFVVKKDGYYGVIDPNNKVLVPFIYKEFQIKKSIIELKNKDKKFVYNFG